MSARGYTLLEVVLVVLALGMLAAIVVPRLMGRTDNARRARAAADLRVLEQALERYHMDTGSCPTRAQGLDALVHPPSAAPLPKHWRDGGYLAAVPLDPWGAPYDYSCDAHGRVHLRSWGADGRAGGDGADADVDLDAS